MADATRPVSGIAPRVIASWWRPRDVVRGLWPISEGALLAMLMASMLIFLIAQMPGHARAAHLDPTTPFEARMGGAVLAVLFIMPLVAYAAAAVVSAGSALVARPVGAAQSRLALFWALLAVSPAMLLEGLVAGLIGPGAALTVTRWVAGLGFLAIWGAGLSGLAGRR